MSQLGQLLKEKDIHHVLIIDDGFEACPRASDLSGRADWSVFFDDLREDDHQTLTGIFPDYEKLRHSDLQSNDEFVKALWNSRDGVLAQQMDLLFSDFELTYQQDRDYLAELQYFLRAFDLKITTVGRDFYAQALSADFIIIDLFLGGSQTTSDMDSSIEGLCKVIHQRAQRPPIVMLMSRSTQLPDLSRKFRDQTGLFASSFRFFHKRDITENQAKLERRLERLVRYREDSLKLARFLSDWEQSVTKATRRTTDLIRGLDLPDHAQIQQLLLNGEEEPTGSYLVEVFDQVLQYEIESESAMIRSALDLNGLTLDSYPPPQLFGSTDLQSLMFRTLFQSGARLNLLSSASSRVSFGDVLRLRDIRSLERNEHSSTRVGVLEEITRDNVLAVLTPACDLQRGGAERVLLLVGELKSLDLAQWNPKDDRSRTPVIAFGDSHFYIKWNLKHIETVSHEFLGHLLNDSKGLEIVARLRESHALQLQQWMLADMGRVGQLGLMPATFGTRVRLCVVGLDGKLKRASEELQEFSGVCFVGRDADGKPQLRLMITEDDCELVVDALKRVNPETVHPQSRRALQTVASTEVLLQVLVDGLQLSQSRGQPKAVPSPNEGRQVIGFVVQMADFSTPFKDTHHAGFVFDVHILDGNGNEVLEIDK